MPTELNYQRTELDNGLRVVTERMPQIRSLCIGLWFTIGSRDEPDECAGMAHFIEHMLFKGTQRRSPGTIAREIESRGGLLNAFTSKEYTCYYARIIDQDLARAVDLLADISQNSLFDSAEVERERGVILEEIKDVEDTPDDLVFEHFTRQIFGSHPLGRPVLGYRKTLEGISRDDLFGYSRGRYTGENLVVAAAGNLNHNRLVKMIRSRITRKGEIDLKRSVPAPSGQNGVTKQAIKSPAQQAHIVWGCRSLNFNDPRKYVLSAINAILGGGTSSRLYQIIREKHGLAYSVYTFNDTFDDAGMFGVYAAVAPEKTEKTISLIRREIENMAKKPVSSRELQRTKDQMKGSMALGLESPTNRMHRLARLEIHTGGFTPLEDVIERIDAMTPEDLQTLSRELFQNQESFLTVLGPNGEEREL